MAGRLGFSVSEQPDNRFRDHSRSLLKRSPQNGRLRASIASLYRVIDDRANGGKK